MVLAGDERLAEMLRTPELLPLGTRIRARLRLEPRTPDELHQMLARRLEHCGNPSMVDAVVVRTLAEHVAGNPRVLMTAANELLDAATAREQARGVVVLALIFDQFEWRGTLNGVLWYLVEHGIQMPLRAHSGPDKGELRWARPNRMTLQHMLHNPAYAGAYVWGRRHSDPIGIRADRQSASSPRAR